LENGQIEHAARVRGCQTYGHPANTKRLFEVADGIYQARGYDLAVMTIIKGDTGYIIIDPLTGLETANTTWRELVVPNLGDKPVKAIIYTHSHVDHIGGSRVWLTDEQVASGQARIIAPAKFIEAAVGENIIAGNVMSRRASYMYGSLLRKAADGQVDGGLAKGVSASTPTRKVSATPRASARYLQHAHQS